MLTTLTRKGEIAATTTAYHVYRFPPCQISILSQSPRFMSILRDGGNRCTEFSSTESQQVLD